MVSLVVSGLNHAAHMIEERNLIRESLSDPEQFGIKDILALGAAVDNMGYLSKPFVMEGASAGTSFASKYGAKFITTKDAG